MIVQVPPLLQSLVGDPEVSAFFSNERDLEAMLKVESALADAQAEAGLIDKAAAHAVEEACRTFAPNWERLAQGLAQDGVIVPELVKQLRAAVGETYARSVHVGATSQDIIDTSLTLRLKTVTEILGRRIKDLNELLNELEVRDGAAMLMAHTRMQQALPFTVRDKVETWSRPLQRQRRHLDALKSDLLVVQLGGPIGTRDQFKDQGDAVAAGLAQRLGLGPAPSWHSQRDRIGEFASWLSLLSGALGKIGQDVALMAQNEIGDVRLATGGGSSAMPHKSNPVPAELLVTLARFNAGLLGTIHQALVHENERSGAAWTLEWMVLPQMVGATASGLRHARDLLGNLTFTPKT